MADKVRRRDVRLADRDAKLKDKNLTIEGLSEQITNLQGEAAARAVHSDVVDKLEEQIVMMMQLADNADPGLFVRKFGVDKQGLPKTPGRVSYAEFRKRAAKGKRPGTQRKPTPRIGNALVDQLLGESSEDDDNYHHQTVPLND